jgi:RNA-binding protein
MTDPDVRRKIHDLDVTLWVGKDGVSAVVEELSNQLDNTDLVKVKFLRAARGGSSTEELAVDLADSAGADLVETRGTTAVYRA